MRIVPKSLVGQKSGPRLGMGRRFFSGKIGVSGISAGRRARLQPTLLAKTSLAGPTNIIESNPASSYRDLKGGIAHCITIGKGDQERAGGKELWKPDPSINGRQAGTAMMVRFAPHELQGLRMRRLLYEFVLQLQGNLGTVVLLAGHRTF